MGIPQAVVEHIMDILQDNRRALKACSLTCKAMFASTRRPIHQTLHITSRTNQRILTSTEEKQYAKGGRRELELRFLSFMAERGLLRYARRLNIRVGPKFRPDFLEPHLHHFQSFDRIHTLTIDSYEAAAWYLVYNTYFTHLYPTLTTLTLCSPTGQFRYVLEFALQFPNLENLTIENLRDVAWGWQETPPPPAVLQSPPLRGHLRCVGLILQDVMWHWPMELASNLKNGINFRSVEFYHVDGEQGQVILDGCAGSLEEFVIHMAKRGEELSRLGSICATRTELSDPRVQGIAKWAGFNSIKTRPSELLHSVPILPTCPSCE